ncbi:hypothetical protein Droror1_Dr00007325 [Drosera rotundifolia]
MECLSPLSPSSSCRRRRLPLSDWREGGCGGKKWRGRREEEGRERRGWPTGGGLCDDGRLSDDDNDVAIAGASTGRTGKRRKVGETRERMRVSGEGLGRK